MRHGARTRLGRVPGLRSVLAAIASLCLMAAAAACGSSDGDGTIPADEGQALLERLNAIEAAVNEGNCDTARSEAERLFQDIKTLPDDVSEADREALERAGRNLVELTREQCEEPETGPTGESEVLPPEETLTEPPPETTEPPTETEPPENESPGGKGRPSRGDGPGRGKNQPPKPAGGGGKQGPGNPGQGGNPGNGGNGNGGSDDNSNSGGIGTGG